MNESAELSAAAGDARIIPSVRDTDESWRRCCRRLRAELGENVFTSWFGRLKLDSIEAGRAQFSVPTRFLKSWIEAHYSDRILAALEAEIGGVAHGWNDASVGRSRAQFGALVHRSLF